MEISKNSLINFIILSVLGAIVGYVALFLLKTLFVPIILIIGLIILFYALWSCGS